MASKPNARTRAIQGQPSWTLRSSTVEANITEQGGQVGPVTFDRARRKIQPYAVAPWATEEFPKNLPPMLQVLRGDFFAMPFGGNSQPYRQEHHPPHGETANRKWRWMCLSRQDNRLTLHLRLQTKIRPSVVDKKITLIDGHNAIYCQHTISGMKGPMSFGHHAMLRFPDRPGSGLLATSPITCGMVTPVAAERPQDRGYSILQPGARFASLKRVPMITDKFADLSRYPARRGFEDIVFLASQPKEPFAWTAVTFPNERYVWFALKDPNILQATLLWMSNGGRHYPPWNGRHVNVMGLEEITSYFHYGLAESARSNLLNRLGLKTCLHVNPKDPLVINYIMALAETPKGFDWVKRVEPVRQAQAVILTAESGAHIRVNLDYGFLG